MPALVEKDNRLISPHKTRTHAGPCQKREPVNTALSREQIQKWSGYRNESSPLYIEEEPIYIMKGK